MSRKKKPELSLDEIAKVTEATPDPLTIDPITDSTESVPSPTPSPETKESTDDLDKMMEDFKQLGINNTDQPTKEPEKRGRKKAEVFPIIMKGETALTAFDTAMVNVTVWADGLLYKKKIARDMAKQYMSLPEETKKELAPLAEAALKQLNIAKDPVTALLYSLGAIYITNYMVLKNAQTEKLKEEKK